MENAGTNLEAFLHFPCLDFHWWPQYHPEFISRLNPDKLQVRKWEVTWSHMPRSLLWSSAATRAKNSRVGPRPVPSSSKNSTFTNEMSIKGSQNLWKCIYWNPPPGCFFYQHAASSLGFPSQGYSHPLAPVKSSEICENLSTEQLWRAWIWSSPSPSRVWSCQYGTRGRVQHLQLSTMNRKIGQDYIKQGGH